MSPSLLVIIKEQRSYADAPLLHFYFLISLVLAMARAASVFAS